MSINIFFSLLVAIVGVLLYLLSKDEKRKELGRLSFFAGLFVFLLQLSPHMISFGTK